MPREYNPTVLVHKDGITTYGGTKSVQVEAIVKQEKEKQVAEVKVKETEAVANSLLHQFQKKIDDNASIPQIKAFVKENKLGVKFHMKHGRQVFIDAILDKLGKEK